VTARPTVDGSLPTLDEHATVIAATVDEVWPVLAETIAGSFRGRVWAAYAALVGSEHTQPAGPRPLAVGSTVVGFRVVVADPGRELRLEGSHRFSTYALSFRLEPVDNRSTRLVARSDAVFPGVGGGLYRLLVFGSGIHVGAMRRQLATVRRRSETVRTAGATGADPSP